jgi:SAM-dependent methyltransferase
MLTERRRAIDIQRHYYAETAQHYETMHAQEGAADPSGLRYVTALLSVLGVRSILDVGTANGCGSRKLKDAFPEAFLCGVEPVPELLVQADRLGYREGVSLLRGTGEALPFASRSFDVVCEFSILHHVPEPACVIMEMLRVARKAIVVGDSNRFGQGPWMARLFKLAMYKASLWNAFIFIRTRGKRYTITVWRRSRILV